MGPDVPPPTTTPPLRSSLAPVVFRPIRLRLGGALFSPIVDDRGMAPLFFGVLHSDELLCSEWNKVAREEQSAHRDGY